MCVCVLMTVCFSVVLVQPHAQGLLVRSQHIGHSTGAAEPPVPAPEKPQERQGELGTTAALARQRLPHRSLCQTSHPRLRSSLPTCAKSDVGFTTVGFLQCLKIASDRFCKSRRPRVLCVGALARLPSRDLTVLSVVPE